MFRLPPPYASSRVHTHTDTQTHTLLQSRREHRKLSSVKKSYTKSIAQFAWPHLVCSFRQGSHRCLSYTDSMVSNNIPKQDRKTKELPNTRPTTTLMACITFYASKTPNDTKLIERIIHHKINMHVCACCVRNQHEHTHTLLRLTACHATTIEFLNQ